MGRRWGSKKGAAALCWEKEKSGEQGTADLFRLRFRAAVEGKMRSWLEGRGDVCENCLGVLEK